ncbi:unnamed protein product [Mytilus coruscus]|uniref:C1q domain-containing protein n=1 Tax=Mytilus coruscus TaxID=42192 RepID=A0A6J8EQK2_MYTCO|nr:unnamed protein product [Mytilus coruscus]
MAFMVLHECAIFIFIISLNKNVIANSCENDNCKTAIDLPLITKLNAPLKAELDISGLTTQLKELIENEVKQAVSVAMKDLAENIVDKRTQSALENSQTYNNRTITSFLQDMEVAITAFYPRIETVRSNSILKFDSVPFSIGINNLSTFKSTGKFQCEKRGIYMISVSILSETNGAIFNIYLNGNQISATHIAEHGADHWHTCTVVIARQLQISDSLWVQTSGIYIHSGLFSCFTIIKVK